LPLHSAARPIFTTGTTMTLQTPRLRHERPTSDYATLLAEVKRAGLLERSPASYLLRVAVLAVMAGAGLVAFLVIGRSWWQLVIAAYGGVVLGQLGFLGHDAGHQQIFRNRRWNDLTGLVLSGAGIGLSYGWWVDKHNRHHRSPNDAEHDPDVKRNVLAWTGEQARLQRGVLRFVARHQAGLFFPLLLLEGWNLHVGSLRALRTRRRGWRLETALLAVHLAATVVVLLLVVSPLQAVAFVVVQQSVFGLYLGSSFAPNHKGMPMLSDCDQLDFLRRQVLTSRNVSGGRVTAVVFGGLNYQIEHHLFPCMPSRNLRRCRPLVHRFCLDHGVAYCETTLVASYAQALRYLHSVRPA
jgi:fatty acid desaturase